MGITFYLLLYRLYLPCCLIGLMFLGLKVDHVPHGPNGAYGGWRKLPYALLHILKSRKVEYNMLALKLSWWIFNDRFYPRQWWIVDINFYSNQLLSIFIFNISCCLVTPTPLLGEISSLLSSISSLSVFLVRYCRHCHHVLQAIQTMPTVQTMQIMRTM